MIKWNGTLRWGCGLSVWTRHRIFISFSILSLFLLHDIQCRLPLVLGEGTAADLPDNQLYSLVFVSQGDQDVQQVELSHRPEACRLAVEWTVQPNPRRFLHRLWLPDFGVKQDAVKESMCLVVKIKRLDDNNNKSCELLFVMHWSELLTLALVIPPICQSLLTTFALVWQVFSPAHTVEGPRAGQRATRSSRPELESLRCRIRPSIHQNCRQNREERKMVSFDDQTACRVPEISRWRCFTCAPPDPGRRGSPGRCRRRRKPLGNLCGSSFAPRRCPTCWTAASRRDCRSTPAGCELQEGCSNSCSWLTETRKKQTIWNSDVVVNLHSKRYIF